MITSKHINKIIVGIVIVALFACGVLQYYVKNQENIANNLGVSLAYTDAIFNTDSPIDINIIMDDDDWNDMLANAIQEEYYPCDVIINGTRINNVGIRPKGNTSLSAIVSDPDSNRYSYKIEFDQYVEGQTYLGLDKLILNNNYADATNMKEAIVYDMYQFLGADASLYNYASISLNDAYIGIYFALEAVEDSFLLRNYGVSNGELYKPDNMGIGQGGPDQSTSGFPNMDFGQAGQMPGANGGQNPDSRINKDINDTENQNNTSQESMDGNNNSGSRNRKDFANFGQGIGGMSGGGSDLNYSNDDLDSYSSIWDGEVTSTSEKDHKRVVTALKNISEQDDLETYLDVDNVLKYMAVHTFAVNMDSLTGNMAHNYYLYEYNGQLNIIPWDYNLSFGGMNNGMGNSRMKPSMVNRNGITNDTIVDDTKTNIDTNELPSGTGNTSDRGTELVNYPIDTPFQSTNFFDGLLEDEEYLAKYHEYLNVLIEEYIDGGMFDETYNRIRSQIDELVKEDTTAFYNYDAYDTAAKMLYTTIELRGESIKGQIAGTIPSTEEGQAQDSSQLVDGSSIDISSMGEFNMGGGGFTPPNMAGTQGGNATPGTGDGQSRELTPENMGELPKGIDFPFRNGNFGEMKNGSSKSTTAQNLIMYGVSAVLLIGAIMYVTTYKRKKIK